MAFLKIARDPGTGNLKLGRLITVVGSLALTFGFYKESLSNGLVWQDYIGYATAMTIMYAPSKAVELINAIRGNQTLSVSDKGEVTSGKQ
jgi:hypothetical protein